MSFVKLKADRKPCQSYESCEARCLFDNCSQMYFITSKLKEKLNLKTISTGHLAVKTFASAQEYIKRLEAVQFKVNSIKNSMLNFFCSIDLFAYIKSKHKFSKTNVYRNMQT